MPEGTYAVSGDAALRIRRRRKRRLWLLAVLTAAAGCLIYWHLVLSPLVAELARARVDNKASFIINEAIETLLRSEQIDYGSIIELEKDEAGRITALKTNIGEVNRLKTQILSIIDTMLLEMDVDAIGVPLGSLILPELFSGSGLKLPVRVLSVSASDAEFRNDFTEAGINQTAHRMMMDVTITMTVLTPVGTRSVTVTSAVVVAETVIVGSVPESYVRVAEQE